MHRLIILLCLLTTSALSFDNGQYQNVDPKIRDWFKNLRSPQGVPCCSTSDGRYTTWRKSEFEGYEYDVPIEGKWVPVPNEAIIRNANNPNNEAIVWYVKQTIEKPYIRCFVLGSGV